MQYFNIQVASQLSGVASATIRAWEKRYNAVVPERSDNKHRLYSEQDIEKLALLCKLTELGQSIGKVAHLELEELKEVYSKLLHRPYDERQLITPYHEKVDYPKMLGNFQLALQAYKLDILSHELEKAIQLLSPRDLCLNLIVPLFQEIGRQVEKKELSIAQEHTLSALVSFHIGQSIGQHYQKFHASEELVLVTTPEGELHEIGILAASLLLVHYGMKFIFMGPNMPAESLAEAVNALRPSVVLLGVTRSEFSSSLSLGVYLQNLREHFQREQEIWVGGNLRQSTRLEIEKNHVRFFPTLQALDEFLINH